MTYTTSASRPLDMALESEMLMNTARAEDIVLEYGKADRVEVGSLRENLVERYMTVALRLAVIEDLGDEGLYAEIPGFEGVWADGETEAAVTKELRASLLAWIDLKITNCDGDIPEIAKINLNVLPC